MKVIAIAAFLSLLMSTSSRAGMVLFDPPAITITPGTQSVSFETRAVPEMLASFETVSVIFGSLEGLELSFWLGDGLGGDPPAVPGDQGIYAALTGGVGHDIGVGGVNVSSTPWTNVTLGILHVDTSTLVAGDMRQIIVNPELESDLLGSPISQVSSGSHQEPLRGTVAITVVPEPTTALGLAMGLTAIFSARRCRRKATS